MARCGASGTPPFDESRDGHWGQATTGVGGRSRVPGQSIGLGSY